MDNFYDKKNTDHTEVLNFFDVITDPYHDRANTSNPAGVDTTNSVPKTEDLYGQGEMEAFCLIGFATEAEEPNNEGTKERKKSEPSKIKDLIPIPTGAADKLPPAENISSLIQNGSSTEALKSALEKEIQEVVSAKGVGAAAELCKKINACLKTAGSDLRLIDLNQSWARSPEARTYSVVDSSTGQRIGDPIKIMRSRIE